MEKCINPNGTICSSRDEVTTVNAALVGILDLIHDFPDSVKNIVNLILTSFILTENGEYSDDIFHTFAVDDILWQGFEPGIIKFLYFAINYIEDLIETNFNVSLNFDEYLPPQLQNGTLAFFR